MQGGADAGREVDATSRNRAIIVLVVTVSLAVLAWFLLGRAADSGLDFPKHARC